MNIWILLQILVNVTLVLGVVVMWVRLNRPAKDDPRLSRGLQLLQSKISVLEDLSDRTDRQVKQLSELLDQKSRSLQNKIFDSEKQVQKLDQSMFKSMEVAQIFQDKIPHEEIIERQNTIKYVKAARMAHEGKAIEEIAAQIDLPREQLEFIAKVNKDQLMFDESQLPAWAQLGQEVAFAPEEKEEYTSLKRLGDEFRQACRDFEVATPVAPPTSAASATTGALSEQSQIVATAKNLSQKILNTAMNTAQNLAMGATQVANQVVSSAGTTVGTVGGTRTTIVRDEAPIRPYAFPRIEIEDEDIKL